MTGAGRTKVFSSGKVIINRNHYKSMQATIDTMFINENIIRKYSFFHSYHETQDKCILRVVL